MSGASPPTVKLGLKERFHRLKVRYRAPSPLLSTPPPIPVLASFTAYSPGSSLTQVLSASPSSASPFTVHSPDTTAALPSSQQPIPNSSFDLFEEALKLLSDGDRIITRKHTLPTAGEIDLALMQAIAAAKVKQRLCIERRWTFTVAGRVVTLKNEADKVVHWLNRFKSVGDVVANVDPVHAGLPWAGIRFLLEAAVSEANQITSLLVGCETALYMANRLKAHTDFLQGLPTTLTRTNFETHLTKLYAQIFRFLAQSITKYQASTFERAFKAFWDDGNIQDFEKSCEELERQVEINASNCDRTLSAQDRAHVEDLRVDLENVLENLKDLRKIQDSLDRIEVNYCLDRLPYAEGAMFNSYGNNPTTCHPETRVDLLRRIQSWAQEPSSKRIFWLNGMAGTGKSTISQTFAEWLTKQDHPRTMDLGASFFFKRNEGDRGSSSRFFPPLSGSSWSSYQSLGEQFKKLLDEPLQKINITNGGCLTLILVIDALDECETKNKTRKSDIEVILSLWSQLSQLKTVRLKLFLTSRPDLPIQLGFKDMSVDDYQDMVLHNEREVPLATIQHDILAFLKDQFSKIRKYYNARPRSGTALEEAWPGDNVLRTLVDMTIPLFIVAATVCRYIGDRKQHPGRKLERILEFQKQRKLGQLEQMGQTYLPVLTQQEGTFGEADEENEYYEEFRTIVGSIVILVEPLSIRSLVTLLEMDQDLIALRLDDLHSVLHIPTDYEIPVQTLHLSFSEFLLSDKIQVRPFRVDGPATHQMLLNKCLDLLSRSGGLRENICNFTYPGQPRGEVDSTIVNRDISPALQYACKYWVSHAQLCQTQIRDYDKVYKFLKKHFLHWLEALALINRISEAIEQLRVLQSLTASNASNDLSLFLEDARRIILTNRYIADLAPLQIYSSAMIFAPQNSVVRNVCCQIPRWIQKCPITPPIWSAELQTLEGHSGTVWSVAFSHDSKLASASGDMTVKIWDASTGSLQQTLDSYSCIVRSITFSHDSKLLVLASEDKTVKIWDAGTGSLQQTLEAHNCSRVRSVAFSHDSKLLVSVSDDKTVTIWDAGTDSPQQSVKATANFSCLLFHNTDSS
ncbi:hypothetical protein BJ875DRAFT_490520 [Amylocarpus encephaloides]|uniref:NACHT domain-containing protein n=1 Tax=Amylocarpus encephaloides TaxID=45428 RepID=A0A9P7Y7P0_9HELO|nr:hypothetical protein BJ875DRAFT_490520 [Amylocarpus encephaloides]